jgi:hypothetical protein
MMSDTFFVALLVSGMVLLTYLLFTTPQSLPVLYNIHLSNGSVIGCNTLTNDIFDGGITCFKPDRSFVHYAGSAYTYYEDVKP